MTHKVSSKIFRIKSLSDWNSRWFNKKKQPLFLEEDFKIREFISNKFKQGGIAKIEIERFAGKTNIIIWTSRPGFLIGRKGSGTEELKKEIEKILAKIEKKNLPQRKKETAVKDSFYPSEVKIEVQEIKDIWSSAVLAAQWIAQQIEKRTPYRRTLKQALEKIMTSKIVKGARVEVSGRLDGIEIARKEWLQEGRLPRQSLRSDIDYAEDKAYCTYGVVGVKVWIYKGERF